MKGGVGKSSSATAISAILTERGYRTLLIDCDQQCNSTDTYRAATVYDVLLDDSRISISEAVQHTECGEILAGDSLLRQADEKLKGSVDGLYRMADALEKCEGYDFIIIATAPGLEEARERLKLDSMTKDELAAYYRHLDNIVILRDNINTEREEGRAEGIEEGERKKAIEVARYLKSSGTAMELIIGATGLSKEEIEKL